MELQTKIPIEKQRHNQVDYSSNLLLLGSCLAENIGEKFDYFKFRNTVNPFGILFHPLAIENLITRAINLDYYNTSEIVQVNDHFVCYDVHSRMNSADASDLITNLNSALVETFEVLKSASHIIITLGTSWVYRHVASDSVVANCHKIPQKEFLKELLSVDDITTSLESIIALIRSVNPNVNFIFTVSPVRHRKDGFVENTLSKSHLISAIHQVVDPRHQVYYFPSYEIMIDELRDYRFYAEDMIHPSQQAVDYIWNRFVETWMNEDSKKNLEDVNAIQKSLAHKAFSKDGEAFKSFQGQLHEKIRVLKLKLPHINFDK